MFSRASFIVPFCALRFGDRGSMADRPRDDGETLAGMVRGFVFFIFGSFHSQGMNCTSATKFCFCTMEYLHKIRSFSKFRFGHILANSELSSSRTSPVPTSHSLIMIKKNSVPKFVCFIRNTNSLWAMTRKLFCKETLV